MCKGGPCKNRKEVDHIENASSIKLIQYKGNDKIVLGFTTGDFKNLSFKFKTKIRFIKCEPVYQAIKKRSLELNGKDATKTTGK